MGDVRDNEGHEVLRINTTELADRLNDIESLAGDVARTLERVVAEVAAGTGNDKRLWAGVLFRDRGQRALDATRTLIKQGRAMCDQLVSGGRTVIKTHTATDEHSAGQIQGAVPD